MGDVGRKKIDVILKMEIKCTVRSVRFNERETSGKIYIKQDRLHCLSHYRILQNYNIR